MEALRRSVGGAAEEAKPSKKATKKPHKATAGQKEMLMPIAGKKPAREAASKKPQPGLRASRPDRHRLVGGNEGVNGFGRRYR